MDDYFNKNKINIEYKFIIIYKILLYKKCLVSFVKNLIVPIRPYIIIKMKKDKNIVKNIN
jgi:hypothetical protein